MYAKDEKMNNMKKGKPSQKDKDEFAKLLRDHLSRKGWTKSRLASETRLTPASISNLCSGKYICRLPTLNNIAGKLRLTSAELHEMKVVGRLASKNSAPEEEYESPNIPASAFNQVLDTIMGRYDRGIRRRPAMTGQRSSRSLP